MSGTNLDLMVWNLAQIEDRFDGLKEFRGNFDYTPLQIIVSLIVVPAIGFGILILIRKLQDRRVEKSGFEDIVRGLRLTKEESQLLEAIAEEERLPVPARIVQSQTCFEESVNRFARDWILENPDPRLLLRLLESVRGKLGFRQSTSNRAPTSTEELDLPTRAFAQPVRGARTKTDPIEVVLLTGRQYGLTVLAPQRSLVENEGGEIRENESLQIEFILEGMVYSFTSPVLAHSRRGTSAILEIRHAMEIAFVRRDSREIEAGDRVVAVFSRSLSPEAALEATLERLDENRAHFVLPAPLPKGEKIELQDRAGNFTAVASVVRCSPRSDGSYRTVASLDQKSRDFPRQLQDWPSSTSEDHSIPA